MDAEKKKVEEIIGQLAGAASLCWRPKPTGVFDSQQASKFVDEATEAILQLLTDGKIEELELALHKPESLNAAKWTHQNMKDRIKQLSAQSKKGSK